MSKWILIGLVCGLIGCLTNPSLPRTKGKLFIIGGGKRPAALMLEMVKSAPLTPQDTIIILPMASTEPDSAFYYVKIQFNEIVKNPVELLFFDSTGNYPQEQLQRLERAKLIYLTGGDQNKFMKVGQHQSFRNALFTAFQKGATIAGTSAGAAVMSEVMITGDQRFVPEYEPTFDRLWAGNLMTTKGMGFLKNTIIDQHFITRSRYNRLISCLSEFPKKMVVGIDESTAILVENNRATVIGESQVIVIKNQQQPLTKGRLLHLENLSLSVYPPHTTFKINP